MTSANISTQYSINNNTFKRGQTQEQIDENTSGGGRDDDLFGVSQNFSDSRQNMEDEDEEEKSDEEFLDADSFFNLPEGDQPDVEEK